VFGGTALIALALVALRPSAREAPGERPSRTQRGSMPSRMGLV
jgi:hypothetical protein